MNKNKLIVVLMSVYKNDNPVHLRLSMESILGQTYQNLFLLVGVDGAVSGEIKQCLESYDDVKNIRIFWFKENRGLTAVLNNLLEEGEKLQPAYFARMDADDISKTDRFEKQVKLLEKNRELDVVGGGVEEINFDGMPTGKILNYPLTHNECFKFFEKRNPIPHPGAFFRASFFDKVKSYNVNYRKNQDTELWYRAFKAGCKFGNVEDVIISFRISEDMFKRRGGAKFAMDVLRLRNKVNKGLGYGLTAYVFGYTYYIMTISPGFIKKKGI